MKKVNKRLIVCLIALLVMVFAVYSSSLAIKAALVKDFERTIQMYYAGSWIDIGAVDTDYLDLTYVNGYELNYTNTTYSSQFTDPVYHYTYRYKNVDYVWRTY